MPAGIAQFLRRRRTSWECFCSAVEERATPVRFVSTMNGFTKAVCYFHNNKCGFSINLNETCHTVHHISTYEDWPVFQAAANTAALVTRFELRQLNSPLHHSEIAPYFVDYLGAHRSIHPSQTWTHTVSAIPTRTNNNRRRHSAVFPTARDQLLGHAHHPVQHPMQHVEPDALVVPPEDVSDLLSRVPNTNHYSFLNSKSFKRPVTAPVPKNMFTVEEVPIIASIVELPESRDLSDNANEDVDVMPCDTLGMFQSLTAAAAHVMTS
ncbi:hypothetical protein EV424DRAFT_1535542 [Suillus variegatus]|nr:hypothetical protein EV424DRAFT_1535542 [Suillus variegatus]